VSADSLAEDETGGVDWTAYATKLMDERWRDRIVSRLTIGSGVTIEWSQVGFAGAEFRLEGSFEVHDPRTGTTDIIHPYQLDRGAQAFVDLIGGTVRSVRIDPGPWLVIEFSDGRVVRAGPDEDYESWSFATDDHARVICLASGELAVWSPDGQPAVG
jgi:hypothetical protein